MAIPGIKFEDNNPIIKPDDDNTKTSSSSTTVPMVKENSDDGKYKIPEIDTGEKPTIFESTNSISETYKELQLLRVKTKNEDLSKDQKEILKQALKIIETLTYSTQDDENYKTLNFTVSEGFHGNASTEDTYEHDTTGNAFRTNNSAAVTFGTKNSNTSASFSCDLGFNKDNDSDSTVFEGFNSVGNKSSEDDQSGDDVVPIPVHDRDIDSSKKYDGEIKHNRVINIKDKQYNISGGADFHLTDASAMYTVRAAIQNQDGIRVSFDSTRTRTGSESVIDNRLRIRVIDPTDEQSEKQTEEQNSESDDTQPIEFVEVKAKNKFGLELIVDDTDFGAKGTYIVFDNGKLDMFGNYKRSRIYFDGTLVDDTSDDKDKLKVLTDINYIYEQARSNGNFTKVQAEVGFNTTIAKDTHPDHVVFGNLTCDAKRGHSKYEAGAHYIQTKDIKLGFAGLGYTYTANQWELGTNLDYVKGDMMGENVNYFAAKIKAAYKF